MRGTHAPTAALRSLRRGDPLRWSPRGPRQPWTAASGWLTKRTVLFIVLVMWTGKTSSGGSAVHVDRWTSTERRMTHRGTCWPCNQMVRRRRTLRHVLGGMTWRRTGKSHLGTLWDAGLRNRVRTRRIVLSRLEWGTSLSLVHTRGIVVCNTAWRFTSVEAAFILDWNSDQVCAARCHDRNGAEILRSVCGRTARHVTLRHGVQSDAMS